MKLTSLKGKGVEHHRCLPPERLQELSVNSAQLSGTLRWFMANADYIPLQETTSHLQRVIEESQERGLHK